MPEKETIERARSAERARKKPSFPNKRSPG